MTNAFYADQINAKNPPGPLKAVVVEVYESRQKCELNVPYMLQAGYVLAQMAVTPGDPNSDKTPSANCNYHCLFVMGAGK